MRLMVGQFGEGTGVYGVVDQRAINLTAKDPTLGADLGVLIRAGSDGMARADDLLSDTNDAPER